MLCVIAFLPSQCRGGLHGRRAKYDVVVKLVVCWCAMAVELWCSAVRQKGE